MPLGGLQVGVYLLYTNLPTGFKNVRMLFLCHDDKIYRIGKEGVFFL